MPAIASPDPSAVPALASLLRRYCFAYTASHDMSACDDLMVEDYVLRMGAVTIRGRDDNYKAAVAKQYRQFPGLGMSVHDLLITQDRAAMHFSEYGRSTVTGTTAAWSGISMYRWDGDRLTECRVEQDYYSRRRQLHSGEPNPVEAPAHDPWTQPIERSDPVVDAVTRRWLLANGLATLAVGALDDEPVAPADRIVLDDPEIVILDCFSGSERAAFHATATGTIRHWPGAAAGVVGRRTTVYYCGIARVQGGEVVGARVVSDRLATERRALEPR